MPAKRIKKIKQTFQYQAPAANDVRIAGDFTNWADAPVSLKKDRKGVWKASISLSPGRHEYQFLVDGQWLRDPDAPHVANPFGSVNSVREVTAPAA